MKINLHGNQQPSLKEFIELHKENGRFFINCSSCGDEFEVGKNTYFKIDKPHYCPSCRIKNRKYSRGIKGQLKKIKCDICGKEFVMQKDRIDKRYKEYNKNLCPSCSKKGALNPFSGMEFSEDQRSELSRIRRDYYDNDVSGEQHRREQSLRWEGDKNPMYKGIEKRSTYTWRSKAFREKVIERDNNTCCKCHKKFDENNLIVHHKNGCNWDVNGRLYIDNGSTLCVDCHKLFHHIYGYGNNTIEQFNEFLKEGSETRI